jgi:hypothetical protein
VIWEPFVLALVLGIIVSAGLYFAYLWPSDPADPPDPPAGGAPGDAVPDAPADAPPASPAP